MMLCGFMRNACHQAACLYLLLLHTQRRCTASTGWQIVAIAAGSISNVATAEDLEDPDPSKIFKRSSTKQHCSTIMRTATCRKSVLGALGSHVCYTCCPYSQSTWESAAIEAVHCWVHLHHKGPSCARSKQPHKNVDIMSWQGCSPPVVLPVSASICVAGSDMLFPVLPALSGVCLYSSVSPCWWQCASPIPWQYMACLRQLTWVMAAGRLFILRYLQDA